jgi:hypothetical protein
MLGQDPFAEIEAEIISLEAGCDTDETRGRHVRNGGPAKVRAMAARLRDLATRVERLTFGG